MIGIIPFKISWIAMSTLLIGVGAIVIGLFIGLAQNDNLLSFITNQIAFSAVVFGVIIVVLGSFFLWKTKAMNKISA
jgi:uncharacterized membrane protein YdjX (TVP38/TMEM64 family)